MTDAPNSPDEREPADERELARTVDPGADRDANAGADPDADPDAGLPGYTKTASEAQQDLDDERHRVHEEAADSASED